VFWISLTEVSIVDRSTFSGTGEGVLTADLISVRWAVCSFMLELGVRWYTVVYILDVYIECLPRVS
jgi:hypothetical protein